MKAVCLLSGGLDSTTALFAARRDGYETHCLTLSYGQMHAKEIEQARWIASHLGCEHEVLSFSLPWRGSALLDPAVELPTERSFAEIGKGIPVTYVPARNTIFLAFAFSWAEVIDAETVVLGANALDYSGYPDCRPEYFEALEKLFRVGTRSGVQGCSVRIQAPLLHMTKAEIVKLGVELGVPFERTWSCYKGEDVPCETCDSCLLRAKGFREAGMPDPLLMAKVASR